MTILLNEVFAKAEYIGVINIEENRLMFDTHIRRSSGQISRSTFIDMGDIVYFMVVGVELKKIGKAAGQQGWYGRMNEYGKKRYAKAGHDTWDATTRKIYNHMMDNYDDPDRKIKIFAIRTPKQLFTFTNPLTGQVMTEHIETAETVEKSLIQLAYQQNYTLDFCREKEIT
jgi:hypothetical protein